MVLFDFGALFFLAGLFLIIRFLINKNSGAVFFSIIISLIGGIMMLIAHYLVMGNKSVFSNIMF